MSAALNLTGQRFGRLIALRVCGSDSHGTRLWECLDQFSILELSMELEKRGYIVAKNL